MPTRRHLPLLAGATVVTRPRAALAALSVAALAACSRRPAPAPPAAEPPPPVVAAEPVRPTVCAPAGYMTENLSSRFTALFSSADTAEVRKRRQMRLTRLASAQGAPVTDDAVCVRAVRALDAVRNPPPKPAPARRGAKAAKAPAPRAVPPAPGGVVALVKIGPYYVASDATPRPNEARATAYLLDGRFRIRGVFQ